MSVTAVLLAMLVLSPAPLSDAVGLYETGRYQKAADLLGRMAEDQPRVADVQLWLGKSYLRLRKWDEAVRTLEAAAALEPGNGTCHLWLGRAYGEKASRASIFRAYGLARKVAAEFETAVRLAPDDMDARFDLLQYYLDAPAIVGGGKEKAEAQIRAIAGRNPRFGHSARAAMYEYDKDWDRCRSELVKSTVEFPKDPGGFVDLAEFLLRRREFAAAKSAAAAALELEPRNKKATLCLSASRVELRSEVSQAQEALLRLAAGPLGDDDPAFSDVYFWLGQAYDALARPDDARRAFEQSLRFDPEQRRAKAALERKS